MSNRVVNLANFQQFTAINVLSDPGHLGGPLVLPQGIQVTLNWTLGDSKIAHNVMYGIAAGGFNPTQALCNTLLTSLNTGAQWTALAGFLSTATSLASVSMRDVRSPNNPIISSTAAGAPGTSAGTEMPNEVAVVITLRTAKTGIGNRGRIYIPGWASNSVAPGNILSGPASTAIIGWMGTLTGAFSGVGLGLGLGQPARGQYTGTTGTVHPARAANVAPITQLVVKDNHFDTQRRRGLK
jgi:hypothetical protein